jgi:hypothetical protein
VQMGMSLCGATHEAPGQLGVRTFRGPGDDVGGGFDGGPALDAQEEGPPPLGVTPDPKGALRAEARPMGIFDAVCRGVRTCHQRDGRARASLGLITRNKSVQAQSRRVGRTCKQPCNGSSGGGSRVASAEHLPNSPNCNLAQLCRKGAGSRKHCWACDEGLRLRAVHDYIQWSDLVQEVRVRRAPMAALDTAKVEARRRRDLAESGIDQPGDALMPQILRGMADRGSDGTRSHVLSTVRACSPLAMPLGSACSRARTMERWLFRLPATNLYE